MYGILYIDKPEGWTSFDVVNYVRKTVAHMVGKKPRQLKVGHTGTLDPAATGLLELCIGRATKEVAVRMKHDKTYEVTATVGRISSTGDKEGTISISSDAIPDEKTVVSTVLSFVGCIQQTPPQYSAVKVNGVPAYKAARAGRVVELKPREVEIYSISDIKYAYPVITFSARVSSGTYIRVLVEDIGKKLRCGAYMSDLQRTSVGDVTLADAWRIEDVTEENLQKTLVEIDA